MWKTSFSTERKKHGSMDMRGWRGKHVTFNTRLYIESAVSISFVTFSQSYYHGILLMCSNPARPRPTTRPDEMQGRGGRGGCPSGQQPVGPVAAPARRGAEKVR